MEYVSHSLQCFQKCIISGHIRDDHNFKIIQELLYDWSKLDLFNGRFPADCGADTVSGFESMDKASEASTAASTCDLYMLGDLST